MEKVQFQLEATLPELKDLYEKGLFTRVSNDSRRKGFANGLPIA
jgi:hypothetical protein